MPIKNKTYQVTLLDNGFLVQTSWEEDSPHVFAEDRQYVKTIPKAAKILKKFFEKDNGNVIPF